MTRDTSCGEQRRLSDNDFTSRLPPDIRVTRQHHGSIVTYALFLQLRFGA